MAGLSKKQVLELGCLAGQKRVYLSVQAILLVAGDMSQEDFDTVLKDALDGKLDIEFKGNAETVVSLYPEYFI